MLVFLNAQPSSGQYRIQLGEQQLSSFLRYDSLRLPLVSAHRGGRYIPGFPENALETFAFTLSHCFAIIECDVSLTKDSMLVMMHDNTLERTTTGSGSVQEKNWQELKQLHLKDDFGDSTAFKIPLLDSVLSWARQRAILTVDVKRGVPFERVVAAIEKYKVEDYAVVITYNAADAKRVYELNPNLMISATIRNMEEWQRIEQTGIPAANLIAFTGTREAEPALFEFLHSKGIQCIVGTMGNLDQMAKARGPQVYEQLIIHGADILSTDFPQQTNEAIQGVTPKSTYRKTFIQKY